MDFSTENDSYLNASHLALRDLTMEIRVRYTECDPMRVVHHSRYFIYFEMARTELFRANGGNHDEMEKSGLFFVVVRSDCHYIRSAHYDEVLQISVHVEKITRAKILHRYEVRRNGELLTEAHLTLALINREGQVLPIPVCPLSSTDSSPKSGE